MKIKDATDDYLFYRLDEIDVEFTDFHTSAYKVTLLCEERRLIKDELNKRGFKI